MEGKRNLPALAGILLAVALLVASPLLFALFLKSRMIRSHARLGQMEFGIQQNRERLLRKDLVTLRAAMGQYTREHHQPPLCLNDLVAAGDLREIPADPMTGRKGTWVVDWKQNGTAGPRAVSYGIDEVHSGSHQIASDGTSYATW